MEPQNLNFGGGVADSVFSPIALAVVLIAGIMICLLPRKRAIAAFLTAGILIPIDQIIVVGGLHFPMLRVLVLFGFARIGWAKIGSSDRVFSEGMNGIDWAVIVLTVFTLIDGALLWQSQAEIVYQFGNLFTIFGVYFSWRHLIRDEEDVRQVLRSLACVCAITAAFMAYEYATGHNLIYEVLGGSRANLATSLERANRVRAAGPFDHPILAGTFGGFVFPLFVGWWSSDKPHRKWAAFGAGAAAVIPVFTGSSTGLFALLGGIGALCFWRMRRRMRMLRWSIVAAIIGAQMSMKAPVWHLISDVSLSPDSSSYHRYMLVDQCIRHFANWALIGTKNFASWGWDMWDLANQYVATADTTGLIPLIAFIAIFVFGFKYIGRARRHYEGDKKQEYFIWAVGASLFANAVGFFGIDYFDQIIVAWYMVLAILAVVTLAARLPHAEHALQTAGLNEGAKQGVCAGEQPAWIALDAGMRTGERRASGSFQALPTRAKNVHTN